MPQLNVALLGYSGALKGLSKDMGSALNKRRQAKLTSFPN